MKRSNLHLFSGPNVRRRQMPGRQIIRFNGGGKAVFEGAFFATMNGSASATFLPGSINGKPATIGGVPLDGTPKLDVPVLLLPDLLMDDTGRGYLCAEVTVRPSDWSIAQVEMVQAADPNTDDGKPGLKPHTTGGARPLSGNRARWPVALLRDRGGGVIEAIQIVWFDLQMRISFRADKTPGRFFFS